MTTFLLKCNTPLSKNVRNYIDWRYNGTRSCCHILVEGARIKVTTRCHKRDHYPAKLRKAYRVWSVHTEYVNQYQMKDAQSLK
ncbi:hypothetical protein KUA24_31 [Vibrio phage HNL01]|nr:hypothetical protein KUA24_31 [Vibrio phage HNL01]